MRCKRAVARRPMDESKTSSSQKTWLERISQAFSGEPQDQAELVDILRDAQQRNLFDDYALQMIEGVFHVAEQQVRDIMVPRSQMIVVDHEASLKEMIAVIAPSGHSRFPVVGDNRDEIIGIILAKDILTYVLEDHDKFDLRDILRPPVFVPESKRLNVLLKEFRLSRNHMAIIADEYGGIAGLVTIEDVIEQIIGDIDDEHDDDDDQLIKSHGYDQYTVDAITEIEDFNEFFKSDIKGEDIDTVGGFVIRELGQMPKRGDTVETKNLILKVIGADSRRVHRLQVSLKQPARK